MLLDAETFRMVLAIGILVAIFLVGALIVRGIWRMVLDELASRRDKKRADRRSR